MLHTTNILNKETLDNPTEDNIYTGDDPTAEYRDFLSKFSGLEKTAYAIKL
jgi:hypothetical protein